MNKEKTTLMALAIGIITALALTIFLITKPPVNTDNNDAEQRCVTSTSTDCLRLIPPIGTPFDVPHAKEIPAPTPMQSGQIDEHLFIDNTLREVNFCGRIFKVKQVMIDGVDVVQRVAELATKNLIPETIRVGPYGPKMDEWKIVSNKNGEIAKIICENVSLSNSDALSIANPTMIYEITRVSVFTNTYPNIKTYSVSASGFHVVVNPSMNEIFTSSEYDGATVGPLGTLK